jgi:hypothetical protein
MTQIKYRRFNITRKLSSGYFVILISPGNEDLAIYATETASKCKFWINVWL